MDKKELTELFVKYATDLAESAADNLTDPNFSRLINAPGGSLYSLFYPIKQTFDLPGRIELYQHIRYSIVDDGDISLVFAEHEEERPFPDIVPGTRTCSNIFVMEGHHLELKPDVVLANAAYHHSSEINGYLSKYLACDFTDILFEKALNWTYSRFVADEWVRKSYENSSDPDEYDISIQFRLLEARADNELISEMRKSRWKTEKTFAPNEIARKK